MLMLFRLIMVIDIKISRLTLLSTGYYINLLFLCCPCGVYAHVACLSLVVHHGYFVA